MSSLLEGNNYHSYNQIIDEMPLRMSGELGVAYINIDSYFDVLISLGENACMQVLINQNGTYFENQTVAYE